MGNYILYRKIYHTEFIYASHTRKDGVLRRKKPTARRKSCQHIKRQLPRLPSRRSTPAVTGKSTAHAESFNITAATRTYTSKDTSSNATIIIASSRFTIISNALASFKIIFEEYIFEKRLYDDNYCIRARYA